jgi:hypothetical protein
MGTTDFLSATLTVRITAGRMSFFSTLAFITDPQIID